MIIKGEWKVEPAFFGGYLVVNAKTNKVRIGQVEPSPSDKHYGSLTRAEAKEICILHNTFRGYNIEEIEKSGIVSIVGNELLKQDEIIQKLINLVEHYGNCYNHDLNAYHEYRAAKKYMEDKQ